jgi:hypothetical protein
MGVSAKSLLRYRAPLIEEYVVAGAAVWPSWNTSTVDGVGSNLVFNTDGNGVSSTFVERDDFRLAQTEYLGSIMSSQMHY